MNNNQVDKINPTSRYQWYDIKWLPRDIRTCIVKDIRELNVFTEPIAMQTIQKQFFPNAKLNSLATCAQYDHKTLFGPNGVAGKPGYWVEADMVLLAMGQFIQNASRSELA
jgi:hypothetical protein